MSKIGQYLFIICVLLAILKLTGIISISWWIIAIPLYVPVIGVILIILLILLLLFKIL